MAKRTLEETVLWLEGEVGVLREAVELLASNCSCSAKDRYSGHLVDCPMPEVNAVLKEAAASDDPVYRDPSE